MKDGDNSSGGDGIDTDGQCPWPPRQWVPNYQIETTTGAESGNDGCCSEEARLHFKDWLGRAVSLFARRSYPLRGGNGAAILHIVGGAQTVHPGDLAVWTQDGYAAANFDWQIEGVYQRTPERTSRFPEEVVAQFKPTPTLRAAVLPVAAQAAGVCLDWLKQCPGVDPTRLGVTGISWGGYLSWLLAAYDSSVRALVPVFGCGGLFVHGRAVAKHGTDVATFWQRHWEPTALGKQIKAPVCFLNATNDFFGDPMVADDLLDSLQVPVVRSYEPNLDHSLTLSQTRLAKAWLRHYLLDGPVLPTVPCPNINDAAPRKAVTCRSTTWWSEAESSRMFRCWLPEAPPSDQRSLAFTHHTFPDGIGLSSPIRICEPDAKTATQRQPATAAGHLDFGLGWRWELGATRHFDNDASAMPPQSSSQPWQVIPARPESSQPVALLIHIPLNILESLATGARLVLGWSGRPHNAMVRVLLHLRNDSAQPHSADFQCHEDQIELFLAAFETLPQGTLWRDVGRFQIEACQDRLPFQIGPMKIATSPDLP